VEFTREIDGISFQFVVLRSQLRVSIVNKALVGLLVFSLLMVASAPAVTFPTGSPNSQAASEKSKSSTSAAPSAADIAAAKASGKVWVNLDSGVYHKAGRWYGKTKNGKFMTVDEAKKAGYKAAKRD
jgi:hypothetical protein